MSRYSSDEARQDARERAAEIANHGARPSGPVTVDAELEQDDDTYGIGDLGGAGPEPKRFRMPGGKWVWVHPLTPEDVIWINGNAARDLAQSGLKDAIERNLYYRFRGYCYQAVTCCRRGRDAGSPQIFAAKHVDALFRNRNPGSTVIEQIAKLSDSLGEASDVELSAGALDFFGRAEGLLRTCVSQLNADTLESWREVLTAFADYASRTRLRKTLSTEDLADMPTFPATE